MTTITLDAIKAEHSRIGALIAAFEAQPKKPDAIHFPEMLVELDAGEHYAGIVVGQDGALSYHLVLLPGEAENIPWADAVVWASHAGGELPTRREQALLYANLKDQFQQAWYWSSTQHASDSDCAWTQYFYNGYQLNYHKSYAGRARAVRRLPI